MRPRSKSSEPVQADTSWFWIAALVAALFLLSGREDNTPPSPVVADSLSALVVYDDDLEALKNYTAGQRAVINSRKAGSFIDTVEKAGGTYRGLTRSSLTNLKNDLPWVQASAQRVKEPLPWYFITKGKKFAEGPLPKEEATSLEALKKVGG